MRRAAGGFRRGGQPGGDRAKAAGALVEAIANFRLHAVQRRLIGRAEAGALEHVAGRTSHKRGSDAGTHDAQNEGHVSSQDTRVL